MKTLIVIAGPTASGKTQLAIDIALELNTEIISCDSRQFFKEMNIGTAKPNAEQLKQVPHHFIGHKSITDEYNAGVFETEALELLDQLFVHYDYLIMVGGSGMYIDAVITGFDQLPQVEEKVKEKLNQIYQEEGLEVLQIMLSKLDREHYNNVDLNNPHRVIRALEVTISSGIPYSELRKGQTKPRTFSTLMFGLDLDRELLYERINHRVDEMMQQGLLEEVRGLLPYSHLNALQTVGYKELFQFLKGSIDLYTAVNLMKQNTRRFAKRQMTWFRKYDQMHWLKPELAFQEIINKVKTGN
jgi:tRNA dimethylallyltransferase